MPSRKYDQHRARFPAQKSARINDALPKLLKPADSARSGRSVHLPNADLPRLHQQVGRAMNKLTQCSKRLPKRDALFASELWYGSIRHLRMIRMIVIALLIFLLPISGIATAQTTQCQSIPKASDRLACCDKATPPTSKKRTAQNKVAAFKTPNDQAQVVDMLAVENSNLDAELKTICWGC